jgi:hypothetical protein
VLPLLLRYASQAAYWACYMQYARPQNRRNNNAQRVPAIPGFLLAFTAVDVDSASRCLDARSAWRKPMGTGRDRQLRNLGA